MKKNSVTGNPRKLPLLISQKPFLKVIAGIDNFEPDVIKTLAQAANGLAPALDMAADQALLQWIKENTDLIVFVSSLDPQILYQAFEWGADILELGNYEPLYRNGHTISGQQVLEWTREVQQLTQGKIPLCITIPGKLSIAEQVTLAQQLQAAGAEMLQIENIRDDLAHVIAIRDSVEVPLLLSSDLDVHNLKAAIATGVEGVGIGNAIRQAETLAGMKNKIQALQTVCQAVVAL